MIRIYWKTWASAATFAPTVTGSPLQSLHAHAISNSLILIAHPPQSVPSDHSLSKGSWTLLHDCVDCHLLTREQSKKRTNSLYSFPRGDKVLAGKEFPTVPCPSISWMLERSAGNLLIGHNARHLSKVSCCSLCTQNHSKLPVPLHKNVILCHPMSTERRGIRGIRGSRSPVLCASGEHAGVSGHSLGCRWHCRCHALSTRFLHVAWLCQATSISKQPQMLPMYAMLQLRIKSFSDGQESKHQQIMRNLHLRLIPPGASFISFHLRCCFRSAVGARLFARLTARHGVFLFTFFTARNISLWRERGSLREVGGVDNNVLLRCALI